MRFAALVLTFSISPLHASEPSAAKFSALDESRAFWLHDSPGLTVIRAVPQGSDANGLIPRVDLRIETLGVENAAHFRHSPPKDGASTESTFRLGRVHFTRTVVMLADPPVVLVHSLVDQPGELSLRVSMDASFPASTELYDRRQWILTPEAADAPLAARSWVLPFESDVSRQEDAILLPGEGEALVLFTAAPPGSAESLRRILSRLGDRFDPGHELPDPIKIWRGVLAELETAEP